jgi:hypothetical protein
MLTTSDNSASLWLQSLAGPEPGLMTYLIHWASSNEAWVITRKLSSLFRHYFEPRSKWKAD